MLEYCFHPNLDVRKEAVYALAYLITSSDILTLTKLVMQYAHEAVQIVSLSLNLQDTKLLVNLLEALDTLLALDLVNGWTGSYSVAG